jgi:ubiquinone/menaquinone biosynthesis C-methylase UbiE
MNKPQHLSLPYAEQFKERSIVQAYSHRPPIPDTLFEVLLQLIVDKPRVILDAGCGTGAIARRLAPIVERVDAVDFSSAMVEVGRQLPNGDHPHLHWVEASMEEAVLDPPYALIVAAGSLHWMDWEVVMPRFRSILTPHGMLAIVWQSEAPQKWHAELNQLIRRYSTNQDYQPYNLLDELTTRQLFRRRGAQHTTPYPFRQSIASYVESIHSRNGFSRERMTLEAAQAFDEAVTHLLAAIYPDATVELEIVGHVVWGEPAPQSHGAMP